MNYIIRTVGFFCAVIFATASLYLFTAFWNGIGSQINNEQRMVRMSQQIYPPVSTNRTSDDEKYSDYEA